MTANRHLSDMVAETVQGILDEYVEEGFSWEWALAPMQVPQGPNQPPQMNFGTCFVMMLPLPLLGSDSQFLVNWMNPDPCSLTRPDIAKQVVFNCVQQLRQLKAEFLQGSN